MRPFLDPAIWLLAWLAIGFAVNAPAEEVSAEEVPGDAQPSRRRIVLIGGEPDNHPPGTHEYGATVRKLKELLEASNIGDKIEVVALDGWPEQAEAIRRADCVLLFSAGADRNPQKHPLLATPKRTQAIDALCARGGGLVLLHWSLFLPDAQADRSLNWVGGYFDYQGGDGKRGWESAIRTAEYRFEPIASAPRPHPILQGMLPFKASEEAYYRIRFRPDDQGWTPLLRIEVPGEKQPQVVAWAVERQSGHRGVGYTGGHFTKNLQLEHYRLFLLNAIGWAAGVKIPPGGVFEKPTFDDLWTPKQHRSGKVLAYERENDAHWIDDRINDMETGPWFTASIKDGSGRMITKAMALRLTDAKGTTVGGLLFDKEACVVRTYWKGGFLKHSPARFGLLRMPSIDGKVVWQAKPDTAWRVDGQAARVDYVALRDLASGPRLEFRINGQRAHLDVRSILKGEKPQVAYKAEGEAPPLEFAASGRLDKTRPHPTRWGAPIQLRGARAQDDAAYVLDTIPVPFDNPHRALMYTSGLDFDSQGVMYVCTAHGDVWQVRGVDEDLQEVVWQRFATGLYQPLGLRVVKDEVYVLGRDQITQLVDENQDGEADRYVNFNDDLQLLGQAHAYAMNLETDREGNFYFTKSGSADRPHGGTLLKVSADGSKLEVVATGFRHPNGAGVGRNNVITAADNEGNWIPSTRIDEIHPGKFCGHMPTHHRAAEPTSYDPPLCWLPRVLDNSAGGQVWVDSDRWGPLQGQLLHTSFGHCTVNVILRDVVEGLPQGGGYRLPIPTAKSGIMRGRFSPRDGQLYVTGLDGWQTAATEDGCVHRVRYTGKRACLPVRLTAHREGLRLTFSEPLLREAAVDPERWLIEQWNYRWTRHYGSAEYKPSNPDEVGHDRLQIERIELSDDGRTVFLRLPKVGPVMQMRVHAGLATATGKSVPVDIYHTIHRLRK